MTEEVAELEQQTSEQVAAPPHEGSARPGDSKSEAALAEIACIERECEDAKREWERSRDETKEAKEFFDGKVAQLMRRIKALTTVLPLFDGQPAASQTTIAQADESWRSTPLTEVLNGFPEKKLEILADAQINTLGELENFRAAKGEYDWGLKGIGAEWRSKIEERVLDWLTKSRSAGPEQEPSANGDGGTTEEVEVTDA